MKSFSMAKREAHVLLQIKTRRLILVFALILVITGCSPTSDKSATVTPAVLAPNLTKTQEDFRKLYGVPKLEKIVPEFSFSLPGHASMILVTQRYKMQEFESGKLKSKVLYPESTGEAIWVKYTLPDPWSKEQIDAALKVYGSGWKVVQANIGMDLIMRDRAPVAYQSETGCLAYKNMVNELIIYAPKLVADLQAQIQETALRKKAVPKF